MKEEKFGRCYPKWGDSLENLAARFQSGDFEDVGMIVYHEKQFERQNEKINLAKLYQILAEKNLNLGKIFEDILEL